MSRNEIIALRWCWIQQGGLSEEVTVEANANRDKEKSMNGTGPRGFKSCAAALLLIGAAAVNAQTARTADESTFAVTLEKAEQGDADGQWRLGLLYHHGQGVPHDDEEAVRWYRLAADQGHAGGQVSLGFMYDAGLGVPQDYGEAVRW